MEAAKLEAERLRQETEQMKEKSEAYYAEIKREREKAAKRKLELMDQGSKLFAAACRESGIDMVKAQPSDDEELKRNAYADRYGEEMSWLNE